MKKISIFGASTLGSRSLEELVLRGASSMIHCFFDNNPNLWGKKLCEIPILEPTKENLDKVDLILVASCYVEEIVGQIISLGYQSKIYTSIDELIPFLNIKKNEDTSKTNTEGFIKKNKSFHSLLPGRPGKAPSPKATEDTHTACTGCANNHLALAKTLAYSFLHVHPKGKFFIFLVDKKKEHIRYPDQDDERIEIIEAETLGIKNFKSLAFRYDVYELCTALRPYEVDYLLNHRGFSSILMIDPDILITAPLTPLFQSLENASLLLFPHMVFPSKRPACRNELNVLRSGVFNCGLLGFSRCNETKTFIHWWKMRLNEHCHNAQEKGFFVDQKWMNFAPALFPSTQIVRDPTYNVAYWNLYERPISGSLGNYITHGKQLHCFHFSSMRIDDWKNPLERINELSGISYSSKNSVNELLLLYRDIITENGFFELCNEPYTYAFFSNGVFIAPVIRKIFAKYENRLCIKDPFNAEGLDSFYAWLNEKSHPEQLISRLISEIGDIESLPLSNPSLRAHKSDNQSLVRTIAHKQKLGIDDAFLNIDTTSPNN